MIVVKIFQFLKNILTGSRLGINRKSTGSRSICSTPEKIYGENFTLTWCPRRALLDSKKNFIKNEIGIADRYFAKPPGTLPGNLNSWPIRSRSFSRASSFHSWPSTSEADENDFVVGAIPPNDARKSLILPPSSISKYNAPLTIAISSSARFETVVVYKQLLAEWRLKSATTQFSLKIS